MSYTHLAEGQEKVYRIRDIKTGKFLKGGVVAQAGFYTKRSTAQARITRLKMQDKWEVVEYDLVEQGAPTYQDLAYRTAPTDGSVADRLQADDVSSAIRVALTEMMRIAEVANLAKRAGFYGKQLPEQLDPTVREATNDLVFALWTRPLVLETIGDEEMLHALLGMMSEIGELIEATMPTLFPAYDKEPSLNSTLLDEELGDLGWYRALMASATGGDLEDIDRRNIAKLAARYPDKFTEEHALNRDLAAELAALES